MTKKLNIEELQPNALQEIAGGDNLQNQTEIDTEGSAGLMVCCNG